MSQSLCLLRIIEVFRQFSAKESFCFFVLTMFNIDSYIHQIIEVLGILAEVVHGNGRMGMQRSNVQESDIRVHTGFSINIPTHAQIGPTEHVVVLTVFAFGPFVARESIDNVPIRQNIRLDFHDRI